MSEQRVDATKSEDRLYSLLKKNVSQDVPIKKTKTYWSKYPELRILKKLGKRRLISLLFFSYLFLFTTAEFTENIKFGRGILSAQLLLFFFITTSAFCFDYGLKTCNFTLMIPLMSIVMGALSCYVCLFGMTAIALLQSPAYEWTLLAFHIYLFLVTFSVVLVLAKGTDMLWQGFFTLVDLSADKGLIEKLKTNAPMEEEHEQDRGRKRKPVGTRYLIARKFF